MQSSLPANYISSRMMNLVNASSKNVAVKSFRGTVDNGNPFLPILIGNLPHLSIPAASSIMNFGKGISNVTNSAYAISINNTNNAFYNTPNILTSSMQNDITVSNSTPNDNNIKNVSNLNNFSINENMAKEYLEKTKSSNITDQIEFFGGFDFFDYDFLFGNDFS